MKIVIWKSPKLCVPLLKRLFGFVKNKREV